jgi:hypothetical protein
VTLIYYNQVEEVLGKLLVDVPFLFRAGDSLIEREVYFV